MMRFCSLGSGSRGNGTLVQTDKVCVLIDCGFPFKELKRRMGLVDLEAEQLDAILVTHEHSDHWCGVGVAARALNIPVYLTRGTHQEVKKEKLPEVRYFNSHKKFELKDLSVSPFPVPHDAAEPSQFVFQQQAARLGIVTDLGSLSAHVRDMLQGCHALLMEFNHDEQMLQEGPYSSALKRRVGGDFGHLNNRQAQRLLESLDKEQLKILVAAHLSEQNNAPDKVKDHIEAAGLNSAQYRIADQKLGTDWIEV